MSARDVAAYFGLLEESGAVQRPYWQRALIGFAFAIVVFGLASWLGWVPLIVGLVVLLVAVSLIARQVR